MQSRRVIEPVQIIGEIGINHNGSLDIAEKLIKIAGVAGMDFVKFQKRDPDICVPDSEKDKSKVVPWNTEPITYLQYKKDIEFDFNDYLKINSMCEREKVMWFASVWDLPSAEIMKSISKIVKIPSAKICDLELLKYCSEKFDYRMLSTGMSTEEEIETSVDILKPHVIFHTNSVYPTPIQDLNLQYIQWLLDKYPKKEIGFSSHYYGIKDVFAVISMGVSYVEKHITLNHDMWGSDQKASVEPHGIFELVKGIRDLEEALNKGYEPRCLYPGEDIKKKALRG